MISSIDSKESPSKILVQEKSKIIIKSKKYGIGLCLHDQENDSKRLVDLLNNDEIESKLLRIPKPYTIDNAKWFLDYVTRLNSIIFNNDDKNLSIDDIFKSRKVDAIMFKIVLISDTTDCNDNLLIGGIGIEPVCGDDHNMIHRGKIGYWLGQEYWGKGYATEAVKLLIEFVKMELHSIKRLEASVFLNNMASMNVLIKAGFVNECPIVRMAYIKDGKYKDASSFSYIIE